MATDKTVYTGMERPEPAPKKELVQLSEDQVPVPKGYHILVKLKEVDETFGESRIVKADKTMQNEEISTVIAQVVDMGPDCYSDKDRFPTGPWCEIGDNVLIRAYSGTRFRIHGKEMFRIINDDSVEATVKDPTGYSRL